MGVRLAYLLLSLSAVAPATAVAPMNHAPKPGRQCDVVGADKLPAGVSRESICAAVTQAMRNAAPRADYRAVILIVSRSRLAADLVVNGHAVPRQNIAISDGPLNPAAIRRFAATLAALAHQ